MARAIVFEYQSDPYGLRAQLNPRPVGRQVAERLLAGGPRDPLAVFGFSTFARPVSPTELLELPIGPFGRGTYLAAALKEPGDWLRRRQVGFRQLILLTSGVPTAYFDGDEIRVSSPPGPPVFDQAAAGVAELLGGGLALSAYVVLPSAETSEPDRGVVARTEQLWQAIAQYPGVEVRMPRPWHLEDVLRQDFPPRRRGLA